MVLFPAVLFSSRWASGQNPPVFPMNPIELWLDAGELRPGEPQPAMGEQVADWEDKVSSLLFSAHNPINEKPTMGELAGQPALRFERNYMRAGGPENGSPSLAPFDTWLLSQEGSIVLIYSLTPGTGDAHGLSVYTRSNQSPEAILSTAQLAHEGGGQSMQAQGGNNLALGNDFVRSTGALDDGNPHISIVSSDAAEWTFYTDGAGPLATTDRNGANSGVWFGDVTSVKEVGIGRYRPEGRCEAHDGMIAEILIYASVLTSEQRAELFSYFTDKYSPAPPAPPSELQVSVVGADICLDWNDQVGVTYNVYRSQNESDETTSLLALAGAQGLPDSDYCDTTVVTGTRYVYQVTAVDGNGESVGSNEDWSRVLPDCVPLSMVGAPDVTGLEAWFLGSDVDADPETPNPDQDEYVEEWTDRICGLMLRNRNPRLGGGIAFPPTMSRLESALGGADALAFSLANAPPTPNDSLIAIAGGELDGGFEVRSLPWQTNETGSIVLIYSLDPGTSSRASGFSAGGYWRTGEIVTFHEPEKDAGEAGQGVRQGFVQDFCADSVSSGTALNDGQPHVSIISSDGAAYSFFTDGVEESAVGDSNTGNWFADAGAFDYVGLGGVFPSAFFNHDEDHLGHFAEVMIFDHPLDSGERDTIEAYFEAKYLDAPVLDMSLPGDCNQDGTLDLSDVVCLLGHLFQGNPEFLPCNSAAANLTLMDCNQDGSVDLSDAIYKLAYLFQGGPPPVNGTACIGMDCPPNPGCP